MTRKKTVLKMNLKMLMWIWLLGVYSCQSARTIPYFKNISETEYNQINQVKFLEPAIQPKDLLEISVHTANPEATASITEGGITATSFQSVGQTQQRLKAYPVSKEGMVDIPILGSLKVGGLSTEEAKELIRKRAESFFNNPSVQIRIVNFNVTVLGEVFAPRTYSVPSEKISILDAIGMAGDLTIYGKRENVLLIRETDKGKMMIRFNLNDAKIFDSPYFYLKQNDVVYVEPSKSRLANAEAPKIALISSIVGILSAILVLTLK